MWSLAAAASRLYDCMYVCMYDYVCMYVCMYVWSGSCFVRRLFFYQGETIRCSGCQCLAVHVRPMLGCSCSPVHVLLSMMLSCWAMGCPSVLSYIFILSYWYILYDILIYCLSVWFVWLSIWFVLCTVCLCSATVSSAKLHFGSPRQPTTVANPRAVAASDSQWSNDQWIWITCWSADWDLNDWMYVCMYEWMYVCMNVRMYVWMNE